MFLTTILAFTPLSQAASYSQFYELDELAAASSQIVEGKIDRIEIRSEDGKIISRVYLNVSKTWVGARTSELYVDVLGGTLDGLTMTVPGAPFFNVGEEVLIFVDHHRIVGFGQGAYTINGDLAQRIVSEGLPEPTSTLEASVSLPDEEKARSCLETSVWASYDDDWALRMMDTMHLSQEEYQSYPITVLAGTEYQLQACNDGNAKDVHLQLVDIEAQPVLEEREISKQAELFYKATESETLYLVVSASDFEPRAVQTGISISISYR